MSAAVAVAPMARKRPAPDQEPLAADANKRLRYKNLRNIDEFEVFEVLTFFGSTRVDLGG